MAELLYDEMKEDCSTMFFGFSKDDTIKELGERLKEVRRIGIRQIIASYKTNGMAQARFDAAYFEALDRLVEACREMDMRFWLEDYAPFPTGSANGAYKEEAYAELNKLYIDERHMDIHGPVAGAVIRIDSLQNVVYGKSMHRFTKVDPSCRRRIAVVAYELLDNPVNAAAPILKEDTAVLLDTYVENGFLKWDVPEGQWRIFVAFTTYESSGRACFMNLLSRESVALEIEKVHSLLYDYLKDELQKTWIGFFYDEPEIGNAGGEAVFDFFMLPGRRSREATDCNVYAWSPEMPEEMEKRDTEWRRKLPYLWYDGVEGYKDYRCHYMDAVSSLVRENYNGQVYTFCQERGIRYIGHVLEDENCHTRLGCGPGHYFRQQYYQDEAAIDVIAGQILPGRDHAASWYGVVNSDGEFYHYGLAKLASSEAHINPLKKNRAAAECFAMYGQQGLGERKFLLDHLMINGVNRMLLAELPAYEASHKYSGALVDYTNQICALLRRCKPVIKTAILYHAEAEWREGDMAQKFQKPGAVLARSQISYDIVPADVFTFPERYLTKTDSGLIINENVYEALIIPASTKLSEAAARFVEQSVQTGFPVIFVDKVPENVKALVDRAANIRCVSLGTLAQEVSKVIAPDIRVDSPGKAWIRYAHVTSGGEHYFLLHNEAPLGETDCTIEIRADHEVTLWDPMTGKCFVPRQELSGGRVKVSVHLGKYEMVILHSSEQMQTSPEPIRIAQACSHEEGWEMELLDGRIVRMDDGKLSRPEDFLGYDFYGMLNYKTTFYVEGALPKWLDLGNVSDCCEVFLNGKSVGRRLAAPYLYDVHDAVRSGANSLTIQVYTCAGNMKSTATVFGIPMDALTAVPYSLVEPMGITGPVRWLY